MPSKSYIDDTHHSIKLSSSKKRRKQVNWFILFTSTGKGKECLVKKSFDARSSNKITHTRCDVYGNPEMKTALAICGWLYPLGIFDINTSYRIKFTN